MFRHKIVVIIVIVIAIIILVAGVITGLIVGFPWERITATMTAKKYVKETYQFTPTKLEPHFLLDYGVSVTISTKELGFDFEVFMSRKDLHHADGDDYLKSLAVYNLGHETDRFVRDITENTGKAFVDFGVHSFHDFSLTKNDIDSDALFEILKNNYSCYILLHNDVHKANYKIDYAQNYEIFRHILGSKLKPEYIEFSYCNKKAEWILNVTINNEDFSNINSPEDLMPYFQAAIEKLKN